MDERSGAIIHFFHHLKTVVYSAAANSSRSLADETVSRRHETVSKDTITTHRPATVERERSRSRRFRRSQSQRFTSTITDGSSFQIPGINCRPLCMEGVENFNTTSIEATAGSHQQQQEVSSLSKIAPECPRTRSLRRRPHSSRSLMSNLQESSSRSLMVNYRMSSSRSLMSSMSAKSGTRRAMHGDRREREEEFEKLKSELQEVRRRADLSRKETLQLLDTSQKAGSRTKAKYFSNVTGDNRCGAKSMETKRFHVAAEDNESCSDRKLALQDNRRHSSSSRSIKRSSPASRVAAEDNQAHPTALSRALKDHRKCRSPQSLNRTSVARGMHCAPQASEGHQSQRTGELERVRSEQEAKNEKIETLREGIRQLLDHLNKKESSSMTLSFQHSIRLGDGGRNVSPAEIFEGDRRLKRAIDHEIIQNMQAAVWPANSISVPPETDHLREICGRKMKKTSTSKQRKPKAYTPRKVIS